MTVRIGFLGAGFIAGYHAAMLAEAGDAAEIVAVFDPDPERAAAFAERHGAMALASEDAVIGAADAVYVATWTSTHRHLVERVAAAGRAVFCEKPLATTGTDAAAMVAAVEAAGVINQVGLVLRDSPSFLLLRHLVQRPESGRLMSIVFRDDQYLPVQGIYGSTWRADPARAGGGTLLEHSIHDLDLIEWIAGPVTGVAASTRTFHGIEGIDDLAVVVLSGRDGAVTTLTSVWHDVLTRPSMRHVEVFCERAVYVLEGDVDGPVRWTAAADDEPGAPVTPVLTTPPERTPEPLAPTGEVAGRDLRELVANLGLVARNPDVAFVHAVATGSPAYPSLADALGAHRLADTAYRSAAAAGDGALGPSVTNDR